MYQPYPCFNNILFITVTDTNVKTLNICLSSGLYFSHETLKTSVSVSSPPMCFSLLTVITLYLVFISAPFLFCISFQVCEMSKQIFYPGSTGTASTDSFTQLSLPTLSEGTANTDMNTRKSCNLKLNNYGSLKAPMLNIFAFKCPWLLFFLLRGL